MAGAFVATACNLCQPPEDFPELWSDDRMHHRHFGTRFGDINRYVWVNDRLSQLTVECLEGPEAWVLIMLPGLGCIGGSVPHQACVVVPGVAVDVSSPVQ